MRGEKGQEARARELDGRKGVKRRPSFWGVLAEEVDPGAKRQPPKREDHGSRATNATKTVCALSLRVTRVLSSALTRGYIFRQGGPSYMYICTSKHLLEYSFARSKAPSYRDDGVLFAQQMTRPDQKTRIFRQARASAYKLYENERHALIALTRATQRDR